MAQGVGLVTSWRKVRAIALGVLATADVVLVIAAQPLYPPGGLDLSAAVVFTAAVASLAGIGAFLAIRVPANRIGGLLLLAGTLLAAGVFGGAYGEASIVSSGGTWPATSLLAWSADILFIPPVIIVAAAVPSIFPDGHLPSPRWRWLPVMMVAGTVLASMNPAFSPGPISDTLLIENPFGIAGLAPYLPTADLIATLSAAPVLIGAVAAVAARYRRGSLVEREQIKWLLAVSGVAAAAFSVAFLSTVFLPSAPVLANGGWLIGFSALAGLPVAIAIAIVRYRLFEIDRLVSRTIGWAIVTGVLVGGFVVVVVLLQALLAGLTQGQTLAVAASTLIAFALFQPLRRRVQRAVDRRFDRARYDAQRTADRFAQRLRAETDMERVTTELSRTASSAVAPASLSIWLRPRGIAR
jgi:hypothetical protein